MSITRLRILGFRRVPPAAGSKIHIIEDLDEWEHVTEDITGGLFTSQGLFVFEYTNTH